MYVINSLFSAFLMYSKIPMPKTEWKEENRRFSLCFFPLIGAVCGALIILWYFVCRWLGGGDFLFAAVSVAIPVIVTGGIHLDGFCDVCDARASWGGKEKMLEIMSDSHIGAFAAIKLSLYLILQTAFLTKINTFDMILIYSIGMIFSRALSGLAAVTFKSAKSTGALQCFKKPAHKKITIASELFFIALSSIAILFISPVAGTVAIVGGFAVFAYYRIFSYKKFGGITGDLEGWFLQMCEFTMLLCTASSYMILDLSEV